MTVQELIDQLKTMPNECHVYIQSETEGKCVLIEQIHYSDMLGGDTEETMTDGVVITGFQ